MSQKSSRLAAVRAVYLLCLILSAVWGFRSFDPDQVGSGLVSLMKSEVHQRNSALRSRLVNSLESTVVFDVQTEAAVIASNICSELAELKDLGMQCRLSGKEKRFLSTQMARMRYTGVSIPDVFLSESSLTDYLYSQLYLPFGAPSLREIKEDPFLAQRSIIREQVFDSGIKEGLRYREDSSAGYYVLRGQVRNRLSLERQKQLAGEIGEIERRYGELGIGIMHHGNLFSSLRIVNRSISEIRMIVLVTLLSSLLMTAFLLRSVRAVLYAALGTVLSCIAGAAICCMITGSVHIVSALLASPVIGLAAYYPVHFIYAGASGGGGRQLARSLLFSLGTSLVSFAALAFTLNQILIQVSIISAAGIMVSFLNTALFPPSFCRFISPMTLRIRGTGSFRLMALFGTLAVVLMSFSFMNFTTNDDLTTYTAGAEDRLHVINEISKTSVYSVKAESIERLAEKLVKTERELRRLRSSRQVRSWSSPAVWLVPTYQQKEQIEQFRKLWPAVRAFWKQAGVRVSEPDFRVQSPASVAASSMFAPYADELYCGTEGCAALVRINGGSEACDKAMSSLGLMRMNMSGILADVMSDIKSSLLSFFAMGASLSLIFILFSGGFRLMLACLVPLAAGMLFSVETLSLTGQSFTVFSLVGLILLFGIGLDYAVFFASMKDDIGKIFPSVLLSFASTEIAFVLLAFSSSRIASGFGTVMASGLLMIFLLSPGAFFLKSRNDFDLYG